MRKNSFKTPFKWMTLVFIHIHVDVLVLCNINNICGC